jgi:hypothetical protein
MSSPRGTLYVMERKLPKPEDRHPNALRDPAQLQTAGRVQGRDSAKQEERRKAMQDFVGIRNERAESFDALVYIRSLRRDDRRERFRQE